MNLIKELKFIVDNNVGKLVKWLRIMGYDTVFFDGSDDSYMDLLSVWNATNPWWRKTKTR
jgi:uncharacterized protein with PIN domain